MANTLAAIVPKILARALLALREQAVMPRLVNGDYSSEAAKKGTTIDVPIPSAQTASAVVPGPTPPTPADTTPSTVQIALDQWQKTNFHLTDKELHEIDRNAAFVPMQLSEAVRALANAINLSVHNKYLGVYGFTGTPGTAPFATTVDAINARKILHQQLCPKNSRRGVLDFDAEASALALAAFADAEKVGSATVKIEGEIGRKFGIDWVSDDQVVTHTAGTFGAGAMTVTGVEAIGETTIGLSKAAGGDYVGLEGDIINIAGDSQTYVLTADATVTAGGTGDIVIQPPLKVATAGAEAVTRENSHVVNLAFHRDAFALAMRPLEQTTAELALGNVIMSMTDPITGLSLRLEIARQYKQTVWELDVLWGVELVRPPLVTRIAG